MPSDVESDTIDSHCRKPDPPHPSLGSLFEVYDSFHPPKLTPVRVLLDTNILIHREARTVIRDDIGPLFLWLDRLGCQKVIHPHSLAEFERHHDPDVVRTIKRKLASYPVLKTRARETTHIQSLRASDVTPNDHVDTSLLAELAADRVDYLITEDRPIHRKARRIGVETHVFTIEGFLEKVTAENPDLTDYPIPSVRKRWFGNIDVRDSFFDSFRLDYPGFDRWFNRKAEETAYVCESEDGGILAFLYVKLEGEGENYSDISPPFQPDDRLKIGTLKVILNGYRLGERFLKIAFDNALQYRVSHIYVTAFNRTPEQAKLIRLLQDWGFCSHGTKGESGEGVFVRDFRPSVHPSDPRKTYPYVALSARNFIVPIYPRYHTELLPDSILKTESPADFVENRPNRNTISKVYVSRSIERRLVPGDIIVFYRTAQGGPAYYTSVATTVGVVQKVFDGIPDLRTFLALCRKRSVFSDADLTSHWNYNKNNRPFVVNFLHVHSLPKRINLKRMMELGIVPEAPRGFERMRDGAFANLMEASNGDARIVVS